MKECDEKENKDEIQEAIVVEDSYLEKVKVKKNSEKSKYGDYSENLIEQIKRTKRNIYVSKSWDKRTETKIRKIYMEEGESFLIEILKIVYKSLNSPVKTTLVQYINGVLKNISKKEQETLKQNLTLFNSMEKGLISKKKLNQARKPLKKSIASSIKDLITESENKEDYLVRFEKLDDYEKLKLEEKAIKECAIAEGISVNFLLDLKNKSKTIYFNSIKNYIKKAIEDNYK